MAIGVEGGRRASVYGAFNIIQITCTLYPPVVTNAASHYKWGVRPDWVLPQPRLADPEEGGISVLIDGSLIPWRAAALGPLRSLGPSSQEQL